MTLTRVALLGMAALISAAGVQAQTLTAVRCDLRSLRSPDADQTLYFYLNDARRQVLDTAGNLLGNVVQFSAERIVVSKAPAEGGARTYTFDRMIGALTVTGAVPPGGREPWSISGECQKVDAGRQKF